MLKEKKIFVLDTSVIIYDHMAAKSFKEHDVVIPITVLEELDNFKKGNDTKNFAAREFTRYIDKISDGNTLQDWININGKGHGMIKIEMHQDSKIDAEKVFGERKADHRILNTALYVSDNFPDRKVVLVTKDINLRIKAKSLNLNAEDYETGKIKDVNEQLYTGRSEISKVPSELINEIYEKGFCESAALLKKQKPKSNHFYVLKNGSKSVLASYNPAKDVIERVKKVTAFGINPRNAEQAFALDAILNPAIKLVTLQGVAGTGKTLLSLAGALEQRKDFHQIYLARPIVPLSNKDIGYLPGDIKSKLNPYMEPLWDNLKYIKNQFNERDREYKQITEMVEHEKLVVCPLAYIRGRSLSDVFFIVDEAQNLTPHEVKTVISRAGQNTKIIFTGDIYQIDTPYLDSQSNGLSYLIDKLKDQNLYAHVTLEKGERSELANLANEFL
ncbi:MAG: phosphate starvation-inducible protein PhoH [Bacteroidetes bacterium RIFCSPLOWO2_12_FULL_35_15]|nr:MAG: phosphate starvation-inducible protein PhoH [Bacteroidetes bacterium RIFCSPLOWO2_12_FULL_35_15]